MSIDVAALKSATDIVAVIGNYVPLKKQGSEWKGCCPFHADTNPSFYVNPAKGLWRCFSCEADAEEQGNDVIGFLQRIEGIDFRAACERLGAKPEWKPALSVPKAPPIIERTTIEPPDGTPSPAFGIRALGEPVKVYAIKNASGKPIAYECRYEPAGQKKEIRIWSFGHRNDTPRWGVGHLNSPRPLYGLDRLAERPSAPVLVTEGPKKADAGKNLLAAYASVSITGGAASWRKHDWEPLRGRRVILWPDADAVGIENWQKIGNLLSKSLECSVQIIIPKGVLPGWDIADAEAEGWDSERVMAYARECKTTVSTETAEPDTVPEPETPPEPTETPLPATNAPAPVSVPAAAPELGVVDGNTVRKPRRKSDDEDEQDSGPLALSDSHLAVVFASQHGADWRYVPDWSSSDTPCWFGWKEGLGWERDIVQAYWPQVEQICINAAYTSEGKTLTPDARRKLQGAGKYNSVISCVKRHREIARPSSIFDQNIMLLGIPGGHVDLETGKSYTADKSQHITLRTSVVPVAGEHPIFDSVMDVISSGDKETLDYLWKWFGLLCTGDTSPERFLYFRADEGAGKSLLTRTLSQILGGYADSIPIDALVEQKHARHSQEWAKLQNKRLVTSSEGSGASRLNEALVKRVTGNDAITARFMRGNDLTWFPHFKLLLDGNSIPRLTGESGMNRRLDLVEFAAVPESRRDTTLKTRIVEEYPAILHSMIQACLRYQREGLAKPAAVAETSKAYIDSQDALGAWMDECVKPDSLERVKTSVAYLSYSNYVKRNNGHPFGQALFTQRMKAKGFEIQKSGVNYFLGLTVTAPEPEWSGTQAPPYYGQDDE